MSEVPFSQSVRAKFVGASLLLLLIPLSGFIFVRDLTTYLRLGQEQVTVATAKLVAASLSDRPGLPLRRRVAPIDSTRPMPSPETGAGPVATTDAPPPGPDPERERILALFGASDANIAASLGARYMPDPGVERILNQSVGRDARVWVVDLAGNVRGLAGAIYADKAQSDSAKSLAVAIRWLMTARQNNVSNDVIDSRDAVLAQSERALLGQPNLEWRSQADERLAVLSVAEPVWQGDSIVAAVIVEQGDSSQRALANRAAQRVILVSVLVFAAAFSVLLWFAFGLSRRIMRLQRQANAAVDGEGRARGTFSAANERDEIGALSRTLAAMVARQASYNQYLEQLAARLSHELRTPVAVVRSSLDNLRTAKLSELDLTYLARADEGVSRLSTLISRMAEATQLERMLQGADQEAFDLQKLVEGCVEGYRLAFPSKTFAFSAEGSAWQTRGVPDAIAQMLDKLAQNAADFAAENTAIDIALSAGPQSFTVTVSNTGPLLPKDSTSLFASMVSFRQGADADNHLGLGLYIAKLIAEFHGGRIRGDNREDGTGVVMTVTLPSR
ncbi:MAG: ATP-binding protein [Burkholderiales bacterium]